MPAGVMDILFPTDTFRCWNIFHACAQQKVHCVSVRNVSKRFPAVSWRGNLSSTPAAIVHRVHRRSHAAQSRAVQTFRQHSPRGRMIVFQSSCETGVGVVFPLITPSAFFLNSPYHSPALLLPLLHPRWTWSSNSTRCFLELLRLLSLFPRSQ